MKRLLSLTALLLSSVLSFAFEVDGIAYNITSNLTVEVGSKSYSGEIVIPEKFTYDGKEYSVTSIGNYAFWQCSDLTSVTIPEGVTSIGHNAFRDCSGLTSVTIPSSVTSIGEGAFEYCRGLTSLAIPSGVTSIGFSTFEGCSGLTSLTIPEGVTSIGDRAFYGCSGLTSLTIPSGVTSIGEGAFRDCRGLTSLAIPSGVTSIGGGAFSGCRGLTSLTIPSNVTLIGDGAFGGCSGLTSIVVKEGNTVYDSRNNCNAIIRTSDNTLLAGCNNSTIPLSVTSIGNYAFSGYSGLTSFTIPEGVTSIGFSTFGGCSGLTTLTIPSSVTSIGAAAFNGCSGLTSLTIPEGVTSIGFSTFEYCSGLTSLTIPSSVTSIGMDAFLYCSGLTSVMIPTSVTSIGDWAFEGCSGLTSVSVGWETPLEINNDYDNDVFGGSNYENATLYVPKGTKAAYEAAAMWQNFGDIEERFDKSDGAVSDSQGIRYTANDDESTCYVSGHDDTYSSDIIIPRTFKGRLVTSIGSGAFSGCSELTSLTVRWGTPVAVDGSVFEGSNCQNAVLRVPIGSKAAYDAAEVWSDFGEIVEVLMEGQTSDSQGVIYRANPNDEFTCRVIGHEDTYSSTIIIPEFYKGSRVTSIDDRAIRDCSGLTSVTIPSSVTSIGSGAFSGCSGLTSIVVEEGNTVYDSRDNCNAIIRTSDNMLIAGCKNTVIPSSVTSIGGYAFYGCSGLTSLTIPSGVTSIDNYAFYGCSGLTSVIVGWETPLEINNIFNAYNYNNATLYVPKGTKAAYEAAAVWQDFGAIFEGDLPQENVELTDASAIDNVIYMEPIEVTKGKEVTVSLKMKNTAGIRGFQFDMQLPFGVTVKKDENDRFVSSLNDKRLPSSSAHTLTVSEQQDGTIRFLCGSQQDETFTGTDGEILTVRLCIDEHMLDGQYPVVLKNVKLTETNINNYYETATVQTAMTIIAYTPGDISGDGIIDVSDYIGVANYIMGDTPAGFVAAAADVNKDQKVDVSDYIGIANMILYNNIYGKTVNESRGMGRRRANTDVSTLDNAIYISPFSVLSNDEAQVSIRMKNTVGIRGFQFDLYLPEGMTAVKDGNNRFVSSLSNGRKPAGDQHTLTLSEQPDGAIRFLCGSQYDETFTGNDGEIATLTINIDASVAVGDYPVYLRNMKLTETDISKFYTTDEVETTVTVTGAADGRVVLDETSTTAPDVANGVNVRVKRTINAGEWSTICLPFAMSQAQCQAAFGSDVEIGDFTGYTYNSDEDKITVNFSSVTAIEANHPYIIKVSAAVTEFTVDGVDVNPADDPRVSFRTSSKKLKDFVGTYVADFDFYNDAKYTPLFLSGNKFWYATELTKHMKAFRAYFDFVDMLSEVDAARVAIAFDEATVINDVRTCSDDRYYNLSGQQVKTPTKGVYVKNGKKVIVK